MKFALLQKFICSCLVEVFYPLGHCLNPGNHETDHAEIQGFYQQVVIVLLRDVWYDFVGKLGREGNCINHRDRKMVHDRWSQDKIVKSAESERILLKGTIQ